MKNSAEPSYDKIAKRLFSLGFPYDKERDQQRIRPFFEDPNEQKAFENIIPQIREQADQQKKQRDDPTFRNKLRFAGFVVSHITTSIIGPIVAIPLLIVTNITGQTDRVEEFIIKKVITSYSKDFNIIRENIRNNPEFKKEHQAILNKNLQEKNPISHSPAISIEQAISPQAIGKIDEIRNTMNMAALSEAAKYTPHSEASHRAKSLKL